MGRGTARQTQRGEEEGENIQREKRERQRHTEGKHCVESLLALSLPLSLLLTHSLTLSSLLSQTSISPPSSLSLSLSLFV